MTLIDYQQRVPREVIEEARRRSLELVIEADATMLPGAGDRKSVV